MSKSRLAGSVTLLAASIALLTACTRFVEEARYAASEGSEEFGSIPHGAGPYGMDSDIRDTITAVKDRGQLTVFTSHAMRLPTRPIQSISAYELSLPEVCGAYRFHVYEVADTQILEFEHTTSSGTNFVVRDYTAGPSPFIRPGLWTAYDHVSNEVESMMSELVETSSPLVPKFFTRGLVTSLDTGTQHELGLAYRRALHAASVCSSREAALIAAR